MKVLGKGLIEVSGYGLSKTNFPLLLNSYIHIKVLPEKLWKENSIFGVEYIDIELK